MAKSILSMCFSMELRNFKKGYPIFRVDVPVEYTFADLIQIIKIITGYGDKYDWDFVYYENTHHTVDYEKYIGDKKAVSIKSYFDNRNYDEIRWSERDRSSFFNGGVTECIYGDMRIDISTRSDRKQTKVYPEMYNAEGIFPSEKEFEKGITNKVRKKLGTLREMLAKTERLFEKEELKEIDEKLKDYFKNKYKISDELSEFFTWGNGYKLTERK